MFYRVVNVQWMIVYYDLQAESSGWQFKSPLEGAGAYCGGHTAGHTACYLSVQILCGGCM